MVIDATAAARRADPERAREWLAEQRVFISSAMGDTAAERRAVAAAVEEEGARAAWFEEFGRDADAQEAYLSEVDASSVYVGILNEQYGRLNPPEGFSATEAEYLRAREGGKRVQVFVAADAPGREGATARRSTLESHEVSFDESASMRATSRKLVCSFGRWSQG